MAKKRKGELPSGKIRRQIYNGKKQKLDKDGRPVFDKDGKPIMIRDYISVTAETAKEADRGKCDVVINKKGTRKPADLTLRQAIDAYINSLRASKSPKTIEGYEIIRDNAFSGIMDLPIRALDTEKLQQAIDLESCRPSASRRSKGKPISSKTLNNEWGLVASVLGRYYPSLHPKVSLSKSAPVVHQLSAPEVIYSLVKGTEIELPVLLAMWLSFTASEIKGLTKSSSIKGDYIYIDKVMVHVRGEDIKKGIGKNEKRNRMLRIPPYIKNLIDQVDTDQLVTLSAKAVSNRFTRLLAASGLPHMSFHDLRHVNASVMSFLDIPDKYAMDRGGWKNEKVMKGTYMQIYESERVKVDKIIDTYFENAFGLNPEDNFDHEKYKAWLLLFGKEDSSENQSSFLQFQNMQHEMQHEIKKHRI